MFVLIVEDNIHTQQILSKLVLQVNSQAIIYTCTTASTALSLAQKHPIELFLLDIQLNNSSGFTLAQNLRNMSNYKLNHIVFISAQVNLELNAYQNTHCYHFIVKPFIESEVIRILAPLLNPTPTPKMKIKLRDCQYLLKPEDVLFCEAQLKHTNITTKYEIIESISSLKAIQEQIDTGFIKCHKSFLVNIYYLHNFSKKDSVLTLLNGEKTHHIPVGRKYLSIVEGYFEKRGDRE